MMTGSYKPPQNRALTTPCRRRFFRIIYLMQVSGRAYDAAEAAFRSSEAKAAFREETDDNSPWPSY